MNDDFGRDVLTQSDVYYDSPAARYRCTQCKWEGAQRDLFVRQAHSLYTAMGLYCPVCKQEAASFAPVRRVEGTRFLYPETPKAEAASVTRLFDDYQAFIKSSLDKMMKDTVSALLNEREEVLRAFIAKYGFEPDRFMQVNTHDGHWYVKRMSDEEMKERGLWKEETHG